jgi:transposase
LRAVGIDDWAWRKGCQYGTVICDLERRRIVALLPDRASGTSAAWLRGHPGIEFIARDRGASYADAASTGAPQAIQIADRWHLFENASASFLDVVRQNMHAIRKSSATDSIDPELLSCAERKRWENCQHRKKTVDAVLWSNGEPHSNRLPDGSALRARRSDALPEEAEWRFSAAA